MPPTKAIRIGIVTCALLWAAFLMLPESLQWTVPGLWLVTLPLAGWVLVVSARQTGTSNFRLWIWAVALMLLPGAALSYALIEQWNLIPFPTLAYFSPHESLAPIAITVAMLWPAMLIVLLHVFKWTNFSPKDKATGSLPT